MPKNILYAIKPVVALLTGAAGAANGTGIDRAGYDEVEVLISTGAATGTPDSYTVNAKLQESDDNSSFSDVSGVSITAITADATTAKMRKIDASTLKRYIRVVTTPAFVNGTSPKVPVAVTVLLGKASSGPVA